MWDRLRVDQRHATMFPPSFFSRGDETDDSKFYGFDRLVTHIDDGAIAAVGELYNKLGLCGPSSGPVLDICSSWISHFPTKPERLVITGMNETELTANEMADEWLVKDINADPTLPFADASFTAVTCCVSVDYLHKPLDVFAEVQRILQPNGVFVCTFSNTASRRKRSVAGWQLMMSAGAASSRPTSMSPAALMNQRHSCVIAVHRVTRSTQSRLPAALPKHDANNPYGGFVDSLKDLSFCERGEAGDFVRERNTAPGGSLPMNTNGGGLSHMHSGM